MAGSIEGSRWGEPRGPRPAPWPACPKQSGTWASHGPEGTPLGVRPTWEFRMGDPLCVLRRLRNLARYELRQGEYHRRDTETRSKTEQCSLPSATSVTSAVLLSSSVTLCLRGDNSRSSPCA
jgi:hypothetical protein